VVVVVVMVQVRTEERDQGPGRWKLLLDREWLLPDPATKLKEVYLEEEPRAGKRSGTLSFYVIRDDLLHPIMGGNKLRKLDAIIPFFQGHGITDVVRKLCNTDQYDSFRV
jgi:hypothetical protein